MRADRRIRTGGAVAVVAALLLGGCTDGKKEKDGADYDKVVIAVAPWAGARANGQVAAHLLREELDVTVEVVEMETREAWDAMNAGKVHAFLEDWLGNQAKEDAYIDRAGTVVEGGDLGVTGRIGWFVPKYFADSNPDVVDWENLNDYTEEFGAPGTGDKGRLIGAEKNWTSYDKHLVKNLDLEYVIQPADDEEELVATLEQHYEAEEPFLTYWQEPHWKNLELELVEVELPEYTEGCNDPVEFTDCAYFNTPLQKFFNADFEQYGGPAAELLRNFRWSNDDQNRVAKMMASDGLKGPEAAARWVEDNRGTWRPWLPRS
ncbi:glycine/betaine ABC transporter substrate-binding protein [Streptomyces sp. P38-E01]|uniref:Glycine/betaine ABC transporter substrate-binding protein n=1 Tax=Streptomyces tardus TaxID=2780544 RepID=A0A949JKE8_9ACTN|nr:glycine betaine ABC transporter substrate-binding protein [Streptomyces tardus]MBU7596791.1 glycine/betaine ABC transporter substrate-binding protein [Streptomyces tardus]